MAVSLYYGSQMQCQILPEKLSSRKIERYISQLASDPTPAAPQSTPLSHSSLTTPSPPHTNDASAPPVSSSEAAKATDNQQKQNRWVPSGSSSLLNALESYPLESDPNNDDHCEVDDEKADTEYMMGIMMGPWTD
jgi:hypothetical protein